MPTKKTDCRPRRAGRRTVNRDKVCGGFEAVWGAILWTTQWQCTLSSGQSSNDVAQRCRTYAFYHEAKPNPGGVIDGLCCSRYLKRIPARNSAESENCSGFRKKDPAPAQRHRGPGDPTSHGSSPSQQFDMLACCFVWPIAKSKSGETIVVRPWLVQVHGSPSIRQVSVHRCLMGEPEGMGPETVEKPADCAYVQGRNHVPAPLMWQYGYGGVKEPSRTSDDIAFKVVRRLRTSGVGDHSEWQMMATMLSRLLCISLSRMVGGLHEIQMRPRLGLVYLFEASHLGAPFAVVDVGSDSNHAARGDVVG